MGKIQALETGISLLRWQVPKGKINPKTLGWVRPDGIINFQSAEIAENYAKNRCISALRTSTPFERGFILRDNHVIAEVNGDFTKIDISPYSGKMVGATIFHGHPKLEGHTLPVSLSDYLVLVSQRLKKVVAFNERGEHSAITQNPKKSLFIRLLPKKWQDKLIPFEQIGMGSVATSEYAKEFAKMFPKEIQKKVEHALHKQIGIPYGSRSKIAEFEKSKFTMDEFNTLNSIEEQAKKDGTLAKVVHNFWEKVAKKLECSYDTNFTELTKGA